MPSQTRWEAIRLSSAMITRQYCGAFRGLDPAELLHRQDVAKVVERRRHVVGAVGPRRELRVAVRFAQLLGAAVQVAEDRVAIGDHFAIELEDHPEHAVRAWVLRSHVEGQQPLAVGELLLVAHRQRARG